jgi:wyosine [tRNA(Phe)-imidazoG37] synthetase (radical SAM superfamily)
MQSVVYGPVSSWRLGKSLGIDMLSTGEKTCSFDCVYCQLGRTRTPLIERREFISIETLKIALDQVAGVRVDFATFSGMGEPTLASNLRQAIELARDMLQLPIAVLTNSSLMTRDDVRHDLALADVVVAKLDASSEVMFRQINRPYGICTLDQIVQGLCSFKKDFSGKLALQMMFIQENMDQAAEMAGFARALLPDGIQINTPLRPCPIKPLTPEAIAHVRSYFTGLRNAVTVYEAERFDVMPLDLQTTLQRRPNL